MDSAVNRATSGRWSARFSAFDGPARIALAAGLLLVAGTLASVAGIGPAVIAFGLFGLTAVAAAKARPPPGPAARARLSPVETIDDRVIDAFKDPVLLVDGDEITAANPPARMLLGGHIVGESIRTALRDPTAGDHLNGPTPGEPIELGRLGGRDTLWEMSARTIADGRRLIHLVDRTQRYALERTRTDFVANASHELRTPLTAILGFVETLTDDHAGGDAKTRARFLGVIQSEARRMQALVEDLMSLSRIEADKHQRPTTPVDVNGIVRQAADELRDSTGHRRGNVDLVLDPTPAIVLGDRAQMLQVVHNLLDNAQKYGRADGRITAMVLPQGTDRIVMTVTDQGDGIAADHLPRLTERFYRVDPGRSRSGGGTGLGLAIVKHIVERHRGRLEIASTLGVGTTVSVTLPRAPQA